MPPLKGTIASWDPRKGYGLVEAEGRRIFLHQRDFRERHKHPQPGDTIVFTLGTDRHGRTCATQATHWNDGGRLTWSAAGVLACLLLTPAVAAWEAASTRGLLYLLGWYATTSGVLYFAYLDDKSRARDGAWRTPENVLHFFAFAGGWAGAFVAQRRLRHKCTKLGFLFWFWLSVALHQYVAIDSLQDWSLARGVVQHVIEAGTARPAR